MDIETWLHLEEVQRDELLVQWMSQGERGKREVEMLLKQLSLQLKNELSEKMFVSYVEDGFDSALNTHVICVGIVEENSASLLIPTCYFGIKVEVQNFYAQRLRYLEVWRNTLKEILSWPDQEIKTWSMQWNDHLSGKKLPFYHRSPEFYVSTAILKEKCGSKVAAPFFHHLRYRIENILRQNNDCGSNEIRTTIEWFDIKRKIDNEIR